MYILSATNVVSDLDGGGHGHLGLVLTNTEHTNICVTPYMRHVQSRTLTMPLNATNPTISRIQEERREQVHKFRETIEIRKAMIIQSIQAMNEVYLKEIINPTTNTIQDDIPTVLLHFFVNYGIIE